MKTLETAKFGNLARILKKTLIILNPNLPAILIAESLFPLKVHNS
jgi:hypothetical protein